MINRILNKIYPMSENTARSRIIESLNIFAIFTGVYLMVSLLDYQLANQGAFSQPITGVIGNTLADSLFMLLGYVAYFIPIVCLNSFRYFFNFNISTIDRYTRASYYLGLLLIIISLLGLTNAFIPVAGHLPASSGGIIGYKVNLFMFQYFNTVGAVIILICIGFIGANIVSSLPMEVVFLLTFYINLLIRKVVGHFLDFTNKDKNIEYKQVDNDKKTPFFSNWQNITDKLVLQTSQSQKKFSDEVLSPNQDMVSVSESEDTQNISNNVVFKGQQQEEERVAPKFNNTFADKDSVVTSDIKSRKLQAKKLDINKTNPQKNNDSSIPPLELLHKCQASEKIKEDPKRMKALSKALEERLGDYGVQCRVVHVQPGPVITRYELELAAGTKASKVTNLAKDLARSLSIPSVRVVEVIPGKSCIGIEIPNYKRTTVSLRSLFESSNYQGSKSPLCLALGVDISGHSVVVDLAKMPHLLVAGTTGSGKSVGLNAFLMSLLFKTQPEELRLILIDPKMLEFAVYEGIPHLLTPVVTDMKDAAAALYWCVNEMERRYKLMSDLGVRNISGYNAKLKKLKGKSFKIGNSGINHDAPLPYIVVMADEFADMMMMVGKKVEQLIARLAQKARAAGIHLVLATQRPSVDVITGLIKANIPTRIAFQVSSKIDSRTIIDQQGAEALLGSGDMLYLTPGSGVPIRAHGAYVTDEAVNDVVNHLRSVSPPRYVDEIISPAFDVDSSQSNNSEKDDSYDSLYDQAVELVVTSRKASISSVQRKLRIGYNRAATIIEKMQEEGIVSSPEGGGREVLVPAPAKDDI